MIGIFFVLFYVYFIFSDEVHFFIKCHVHLSFIVYLMRFNH
jgi:hypothetical protein